jgi:hypothetical protein
VDVQGREEKERKESKGGRRKGCKGRQDGLGLTSLLRVGQREKKKEKSEHDPGKVSHERWGKGTPLGKNEGLTQIGGTLHHKMTATLVNRLMA